MTEQLNNSHKKHNNLCCKQNIYICVCVCVCVCVYVYFRGTYLNLSLIFFSIRNFVRGNASIFFESLGIDF